MKQLLVLQYDSSIHVYHENIRDSVMKIIKSFMRRRRMNDTETNSILQTLEEITDLDDLLETARDRLGHPFDQVNLVSLNNGTISDRYAYWASEW